MSRVTDKPSAAFTPGPWHVKPGNVPGFKTGTGGPGIYAPARREDDFFILQIAAMETNVPAREIDANARLIAAAPDQHAAAVELDRLLLVIESAVRADDPRHHAEVLTALKANRAAIAKALGQQVPA